MNGSGLHDWLHAAVQQLVIANNRIKFKDIYL